MSKRVYIAFYCNIIIKFIFYNFIPPSLFLCCFFLSFASAEVGCPMQCLGFGGPSLLSFEGRWQCGALSLLV